MTEPGAADAAFGRALDRFGYLVIATGVMMFPGIVQQLRIPFFRHGLRNGRHPRNRHGS